MATPPQVVPAIFGKAGAPAADAASSAASLRDGFTCGSAHGALIGAILRSGLACRPRSWRSSAWSSRCAGNPVRR